MAGVASVRRALRILETLATADTSVPLSIVAKRVGLAPSTTHNLLITLVEENYATNVDGSYRLGPRAAAIASTGGESLHDALSQAADQLAATTGHSAVIVSLIDGHPKEIAHSPGTDLVTVSRTSLTDTPALGIATGRLLVAFEGPDRWADHIARERHATDWSADRWNDVLALFAATGFGMRLPLPDDSPRVRASGVAVPVWHRPGSPAWAIGCSTPWTISATEALTIAQHLWETARELSHRLGAEDYPVAEPTRGVIATVHRAAR